MSKDVVEKQDDVEKPISFVEWLISRELSERTIKQYFLFAKLFSDYCDGEVTQVKITRFLIKHKHPVARASVSNYLEFGNIRKKYDLPKKRGRKKKRLPKHLLPYEIGQLAGHLNFRNSLLVWLMYEGGLRVSEVLNVKKRNIDLENRRIKVIGKGNKERRVNFSNNTKGLLIPFIRELGSASRLFPIGSHWAWEIVKKAGDEALGKKVTPHMFRHSMGTFLINKGVPIEKIAVYFGHDDLRTTTIYTRVDSRQVEEAVKEIIG